jgi:hypothetical protein
MFLATLEKSVASSQKEMSPMSPPVWENFEAKKRFKRKTALAFGISSYSSAVQAASKVLRLMASWHHSFAS